NFSDNKGEIIVDLQHRDKLIEGKIEQAGPNKIRGYRISEAWAREQHVYFEMEFNEKISAIKINKDTIRGDYSAIIEFSRMPTPVLEMRTGISFTDNRGASANLRENPSFFGYEKFKQQATEKWNEALGCIRLKGGTEVEKQIFYTALYHTMVHPNTASDVDGRYRGMDMQIHQDNSYTHYTVFSLWDTFRAAHPLYAILFPQKQRDFIRSFLSMYQQGGRLPVWELAANETDCMIGYHSVPVIVDSWFKGIRDFDSKLALEAMVKSSTWKHLGLPEYMDHGYLAIEDEPESVSKTLEYAYDDWCIARFADEMGNKEQAREYYLRSQGWKHLFDQTVGSKNGFMRPRNNGAWLEPFDPFEVNNHYTEANSWQYSFFVPHDLKGLQSMYYTNDGLFNKLNLTFNTTSRTTGREQSDITGLIGQYAHGNEPSHHMAWMFTELGHPAEGQKYIKRILETLYTNEPDGLSGNEDCGQMSAWYVFSAMGFYPFCPGKPEYTVGNPLFNQVIITPAGGNKSFTIETEGEGEWAEFPGFRLEHSRIINGETLKIKRSNSMPASFIPDLEPVPGEELLQAPVFGNSKMVFRDSMELTVNQTDTSVNLYYSMDKSIPDENSIPLKSGDKIKLYGSTTVKMIAIKNGLKSPVVTAKCHKIPNNYSIQIKSKYNPQYTAGGDAGIIDGLLADVNWRKGGWQGYQSQDFECVIDLKKEEFISQLSASFLQDTRSWIVFPKSVSFEYSENGEDWILLGTDTSTVPANNYETQRWFASALSGFSDGKPEPMFIFSPVKARYVRVKAENFGMLPEWHLGAGGDAFIFIEIGRA
ncbi:MAG: GH92 family glycosyl hydrolase, partial [Bacteroidetes bacterium]|nr:GH92 family glycosyl hydrolase [Bacteroidota bacterium]